MVICVIELKICRFTRHWKARLRLGRRNGQLVNIAGSISIVVFCNYEGVGKLLNWRLRLVSTNILNLLYAYARSHYSFTGGILPYFFDLTIGILWEHFGAGGKPAYVRLRRQRNLFIFATGFARFGVGVVIGVWVVFLFEVAGNCWNCGDLQERKKPCTKFWFCARLWRFEVGFLPTW
jgi:hypothetical protein